MTSIKRWFLLASAACLVACQPSASVIEAEQQKTQTSRVLEPTPAHLYGKLFEEVQLRSVFADNKTFVDARARHAPEQVMQAYRAASKKPDFDLAQFVTEHFEIPRIDPSGYQTSAQTGVEAHIDQLWSVLERKRDEPQSYSSLIPLPHPYIVPGGRFAEIYYWDSYFTMLGLAESGRTDLLLAMLDNFAYLIDKYGHIPNGNRTYFLSRSQPPFFAAMVELAASVHGQHVYDRYLRQLKAEHAFWMDGVDSLRPNQASRRVIRLSDGSVLNRYWDDRDTPREESYREDVALAKRASRPAPEVYRELRAAAESGWDFSSRWLADGKNLHTIHTTDLVPPDLNSLLHQLELTIAKACSLAADTACVSEFQNHANLRRAAVERWLWDEQAGAYVEFDWRRGHSTGRLSSAMFFPLFLRIAEPERAKQVAVTARSQLLQPYGLSSTPVDTGQQWDLPNGFAPMQWVAIEGLRNYGEHTLATDIARRWITLNLRVFRNTGKLVEKYDVVNPSPGGGGEYPLQDGFGWTNGVLRKLLAVYPEHAKAARAERMPLARPTRRMPDEELVSATGYE